MLKILIAGVVIAASFVLSAESADAFGGRGYARRVARHHVHHAPVVVRHAPVVRRVYVAPVVSHYRAPVYHRPSVSVNVGRYGGYYGYRYPSYGGVSIGIGW